MILRQIALLLTQESDALLWELIDSDTGSRLLLYSKVLNKPAQCGERAMHPVEGPEAHQKLDICGPR